MTTNGLCGNTMRFLLGMTAFMAGHFTLAGLARAQVPTAEAGLSPVADTASAVEAPGSATALDEVVQAVDGAGPAADAGPPPGPPFLSAGVRVQEGPLGVIGESLFGNLANRTDLWRPLSLRSFFSEGWLEPWRHSPTSSGGAPRQPWINSLDGVFYRVVLNTFSDLNEFQRKGAAYIGSTVLFAPISRRFQVRFDMPFVVSDKGGSNDSYHNNFGDFIVTPRFLLSETRDLTQIFSLAIRTPTGAADNGYKLTTLSPHYEFWYGLPRGWVVRGSTGATVATTTEKFRDTYDYNLAVGKYWTPYSEAAFSDFVTYLSMNGFTTLEGPGSTYSFFSLTPGIRFHLGKKWYFLGGVDVPVTGPKHLNFSWGPLFAIAKLW